MGKTTTFGGRVRSRNGSRENATGSIGTAVCSAVFSFNPSSVSLVDVRIGYDPLSGEKFVLPTGSIPLQVYNLLPATGGTNPTVDLVLTSIGGADEAVPLANELDADNISGFVSLLSNHFDSGASTQPFRVRARAGSSAATGQSMTVIITYAMLDDGKAESAV